MRLFNQFSIYIFAIIALVTSSVAFGQSAYTPLDLSSGFTSDMWCGPLEYQAVMSDGGADLMTLQGGYKDGVLSNNSADEN